MTSAELAKLDELRPGSRPLFEALIKAMNRRGYDPCIGTVWRSGAAQLDAIKRGTTSARQRLSWHMFTREDENAPGKRRPASRAIDFRRRLPNGLMDETTLGPEDFWRALSEEAAALGLRCLAYRDDGSKLLLDGKTWDPGHVEDRSGYETLKAAIRAESPELLA